MGRKYFGTDGVRGTVGEAPITPEFVMRLGYAAGTTLVAQRVGHCPVRAATRAHPRRGSGREGPFGRGSNVDR